ncbi:winged helix-turn-helix domain-containing protein [Ruegeria sp. 2205SS24-7]|uniref:winged helix-turn-helix domain-containing tetratricopeptide repeat protein n=1 Tax=Ruegeria discodermiae TaxID=3064389 RepID=UPI002741EDBA|nr:winged helix-turn-helix domain-containing protein [Ruegeria sp. 2205SS24-7]MDP5218747.1 winged helix-turn-helix domain-containing protein [Ruegeria sp. 2205SS24-7]
MEYRFDKFTLSKARVELRSNDALVALEPKTFDLLLFLVENHHRAVSKDQVLEAVWPGVFVSDASISQSLKQLRRALGDDGKNQNFIKTLRGKGYRFVADVTEVASKPATPRDPPLSTLQGQQTHQLPGVAVLPFDLVGETNGDLIMSVAIAHDVIQALSRLHWLRVIARATAFQFKDRPLNEVTEQLGVKYCLTGTIERLADRLMITVELVDLLRNSIVWVDQFEGSVDDVHDLRAKIVRGTMASIEMRISRHEARFLQSAATESLDAWSSFHVGLVHMYRFTQSSNARAISLFDRAISLDPAFAKAHAALSFAHFQSAFNVYEGTDTAQSTKIAIAAAERSLELDEFDHFANFVRGRACWLTGDLEPGLDWVSRSIEINPNFAQGYYSKGLLGVLSDTDIDFEGASEQATLLSPMDPLIYGFHGIRALGYLNQGAYSDAALWANKSANAPNALVIMDLVAVIANDLAGHGDAAQRWASRALERYPGIDGGYLFSALPFRNPDFQTVALQVLGKYGI